MRYRLLFVFVCTIFLLGFAAASRAGEGKLTRLTPTADYFAQLEKEKVTKDVAAQIKYLFYEDFEAPLYHPGGYFEPWRGIPDRFIRYSLADISYALANAARIDPSLRALAAHGIDFAIQKMRHKRMWGDWAEDGFGEDPLAQGNIMYKGHLNTMYGLFQLLSDDRRYEEDNTRLTKLIFEEIKANPFAGIVCEPDNYFPQCNSLGYYSLMVYDKIHGTTYAEVTRDWILWLEKNLIDGKTGMFYLSYHPSLRVAKPYISAYTTAWTLTLIHGMDPGFAETRYPLFKKLFVRTSPDGTQAFVRETNDTEDQDSLATCYALLLAKEMGDYQLFDQLMNFLEAQGEPKYVNGQLIYQKKSNPFFAELLLWAKTHVGTRELLEGSWPGAFKSSQAKAE